MNEPMCVASRGRNPDCPSDRTAGTPTEQRLEVNQEGVANCLTSVQKDCMVLTPKRTEYGKAIRKAYESGEAQESRHNMTRLEPRQDGVSNTLTTVQKDNMVLQSVKIKQATKDGYIDCEIGGVADLSYPNSETRRGRVQENGTISPTLTAGENDICRIESGYRIRKLTPRSCGRLMNVTDEDISKMVAVNSNTQLYKGFGNSIVISCLAALFSQLNIQGVKPWNDMTEKEREVIISGRNMETGSEL